MGTHGRQGESCVPKARTTGMRREVKKALGKDYRDKEGKKGKEEKNYPLRPKCRRPGKKHGSGERIRRQVGDK